MIYLYQALVSVAIGFASTAISDTWVSGVLAGTLCLWINFAIGGQLR